MIVDITTPATLDSRTVRSISLRLPGRDLAQALAARIDAEGGVREDEVEKFKEFLDSVSPDDFKAT